MNTKTETVTEPIRSFLKTANERTTEFTKELQTRSSELGKEARTRGENIVGEAVSLTRDTVFGFESAVLDGIGRALDQAIERAPEADLLTTARKRIVELKKEATKRAKKLPLPDYDKMSAKAIIDAIQNLSFTKRRILANYERDHKARKTVLQALGL